MITGKTEENKDRCRPREHILDGMASWLGRKTNELDGDTRDRNIWRAMIEHTGRHSTR
jgi:hypothetical protein